MTATALRTDWTDRLACGMAPGAAELRAHLRAVHRAHAGFTERCAARCRDAEGRTSYAWLAEAVAPERHATVLDLACGSGPLLQLCHETLPPRTRLVGIDMSPEELALARARLPEGRADLVEARADRLDVLADATVDAVLCHWALTLMDPVAPVLAEIARILAPGGRFAAIVDGPMDAAPGYAGVHDLIYAHVQAEFPAYGAVDLGDPRVRAAEGLTALVRAAFPEAAMRVETGVVAMSGPAATLAEEAAGFFYAAFVLPPVARLRMLGDLAELLSAGAGAEAAFAMPINRLVVDLPPAP